MEDIIEEYYNSSNFASVDKIYKLMKEDNHNIKKSDIKKYIDTKTEAQLLKESKKSKLKLGHITSLKPYSIFQMDIFYLTKVS